MGNFRAQAFDHLFLKGDEGPQQLNVFKKNTVVCTCNYVGPKGETAITQAVGLISCRTILMPYHSTQLEQGKKFFIKVYQNSRNIVYDQQEMTVVYSNKHDDLIIAQFPPEVPVLFKKIKLLKESYVRDLFLITPQATHNLEQQLHRIDFTAQYVCTTGFKGKITPLDVMYDINLDGLCGSPLVTKDGMLLGMHIAGNDATGISKIFSLASYEQIHKLFSSDDGFELPMVDTLSGSLIPLDRQKFNFVSSTSTIVPSQVSGIFEELRKPANLNSCGRNTAMVMSQKSHKSVAPVDLECLAFATDYVKCLLPKFEVSSDKDVICGNDYVQGLDKKTSCGFGFEGTKADFMDFDKGKFYDHFEKCLNMRESQFIGGTYPYDSYHCDTLKDELRDVEKVDKPRVFKTSPLDILCLTRRYTLGLVAKLRKNMFNNGIMVGINPFSHDWEHMLKNIIKNGDNVFDGDYGNWDGGMLSQFQQYLNTEMVAKFNGTLQQKKILSQLLTIMMYTPTITQDKVYLTTHSLPSGTSLTSYYNSLVNKMYGAYVFCHLYRSTYDKVPSVDVYTQNVQDCVYGDDKLVGVSDKFKDMYNGPSYESVMNLLGINFTPANKGEWYYKTRSVYECTFLKRSFVIHPKLGVVAPLQHVSMLSTLNYVKDDFRNQELTEIKLLNFQREAFLWYNDYTKLMSHVHNFIQDKINLTFLDEDYLCKLYSKGDYGSMIEMY
jgi:hypothetical protein